MAVVLVLRVVAGDGRKLLRSVAILIAAALGGLGLSALDRFGVGWPVYFFFFLAPLIIGVVGAMVQNLSRVRYLYAPGSKSEFVVQDGRLMLDLNTHKFGSKLSDLVRIRRFASSAVLVYNDDKILLVPWVALPAKGPADGEA